MAGGVPTLSARGYTSLGHVFETPRRPPPLAHVDQCRVHRSHPGAHGDHVLRVAVVVALGSGESGRICGAERSEQQAHSRNRGACDVCSIAGITVCNMGPTPCRPGLRQDCCVANPSSAPCASSETTFGSDASSIARRGSSAEMLAPTSHHRCPRQVGEAVGIPRHPGRDPEPPPREPKRQPSPSAPGPPAPHAEYVDGGRQYFQGGLLTSPVDDARSRHPTTTDRLLGLPHVRGD
jgi:hypothetical protein